MCKISIIMPVYNKEKYIKKAIESMTGLRVVEVNVHVQGVNIEKEKPVKELPEGGKDDASAPRVR